MSQPRHLFLFLLVLIPGIALRASTAPFDRESGDPKTLQAELVVDSISERLLDQTDQTTPEITGGRVVPDERFGTVVSFGDGADNEIRIVDKGKFDFREGFTFETWMKFDARTAEEINGAWFVKHGTAVTKLDRGRLTTS